MAIQVERESLDFMGCELEHCFRCNEPTQYWYRPNDVPCCTRCAEIIEKEQVPTKEAWILGDFTEKLVDFTDILENT